MIKTGIFGGSFNPMQQADLLSDELRLQMARMALEYETGIMASDYEMHLPKPSYTWLTLQALSRDYPDRQFVLMIGGDNWAIFDKWYHANDILQHYQVVVYPRRNEQPVKKNLPATVMMVEAELLDISSTEIRQRIREGRSHVRFGLSLYSARNHALLSA